MSPQIRPYVSPSQLATFIECPRKWGWEKLENLRGVQKPTAALGERVHKILEAWLTSATPPNRDETFIIDEKIYYPGVIAESGIHLLPPPGSGFVESWFAWRIFNGRIDFAWKGPECPAVLDHKTTSNLGYAKTSKDLETDPQAIIYASAALEETSAHAVDLFWVYYKTTKPYKAERVHLRVTREYAEAALRPLAEMGEQMLAYRRSGARAKDLPPNANACGNYGGCDFIKQCDLSSQEIMRSMYMAEMSLEQKIQAHKAAQNGAAIPPLTPSVGAPQLPGGVPVVPLAAVPSVPAPGYAAVPPPVPPAIPVVAAPPPVPPPTPAPRWVPHPYNAAYEWLEGTDQTRPAQTAQSIPAAVVAHVDMFNAPESAGLPERAQPPPPAPAAEEKDESMAGDVFDTMDGDALRAFAKTNGLEPKKGLKEKNLRITVRTLWASKSAAQPMLPAVPAAPSIPVVPAAFIGNSGNGAAPVVPVVPVVPAAPSGAYTQEMTEAFTEAQFAPQNISVRADRVTAIAAAMIAARDSYADSLDLARTANSIVEAIERVSKESFRSGT